MTKDQERLAKRMKEGKCSLRAISAALPGVPRFALRRLLYPETVERERASRRVAMQGVSHVGEYDRPIDNDELKRRRRLIPPDTRDFNARFFGDPPPGRSALAMRAEP